MWKKGRGIKEILKRFKIKRDLKCEMKCGKSVSKVNMGFVKRGDSKVVA